MTSWLSRIEKQRKFDRLLTKSEHIDSRLLDDLFCNDRSRSSSWAETPINTHQRSSFESIINFLFSSLWCCSEHDPAVFFLHNKCSFPAEWCSRRKRTQRNWKRSFFINRIKLIFWFLIRITKQLKKKSIVCFCSLAFSVSSSTLLFLLSFPLSSLFLFSSIPSDLLDNSRCIYCFYVHYSRWDKLHVELKNDMK